MGYTTTEVSVTSFKKAILESGQQVLNLGTVKTASTSEITLYESDFDVTDVDKVSMSCLLGTGAGGGVDTATLELYLDVTSITALTSTQASERQCSLNTDISGHTGVKTLKVTLKTDNAGNFAHAEDLRVWCLK